MAFTVKLTRDTSVGIGETNQATNKIGIEVQSTEAAKVKITVTVRCGGQGTDLLESPTTGVTVGYQADGQPGGAKDMSPDSATASDLRAWNTGSRPVNVESKISISLDKFVSNTPPGKTEIAILVQTFAQGWSAGESFTKVVEKPVPVSTVPAIHYFTVNPDYVLHAGQTPVSVNFYATGYETLTLFRNNEEVQVRPEDEAGVAGAFEDKPSITSVYRLEGAYRTPEAPDTLARETLYRNLQVISPGWNAIGLPQGSPVRLFVANDFSGSGADRLYGIFKNSGGQYVLYSSATGVDSWRPERGDLPQHMAMSPGVYYNNKLWLIGGSAVDPDVVSNEIWCYGRKDGEDTNSWTNPFGFPEEMDARMGHACVVFPRKVIQDNAETVVKELWILGGYNNGTAYQDVWRLQPGGQPGFEWKCLQHKSSWGSRLNHAAVSYRNPRGENQVWMYGGGQEPYTGRSFYDIWSTNNGESWEEMKLSGSDSTIVPDPGRPIGAALVTFGQDGASERLFLLGSFKSWATSEVGGTIGNRISSFMFEWHNGTKVWETRPVFNGWQQFQGDNFYMQAVTFNRFLFVWSLPARIESTLKLNILIT